MPHRDRTPLERRVHAAALRALDLTAEDRDGVLERMFTRRRRDAVSYWLQLLLSMAIATVGLVLGSTAVVIGAMLIAPLMGPIVELGMGLVVGSPVLTLRSFGRMTGSVLATVAGAALLTVLLPFHEVTAEVASRTSPTALDLLLAVFVAVAAAFTTARPGSETTSAAAGTAIGIALVPPLCVIGFGVGIGDWEVAGGATLLFLTNLTAILLVSVLFFWTLGFETVDEMAWEEVALAETPPNGWTRTAVGGLRAVFGSRYGRVVRVGLPLALVAAVFVPLSQALEQVAWEVRARTAVGRILNGALESRRAVQSQVAVTQGAVSAQLYLVGSADDAAVLERELVTRIAAETGVVPAVRVIAVPDADALRQTAATRDAAPAGPPPPDVDELRRQVGAAVRAAWPAAELGPLVSWRLEVPDSAAPVVRVEHLGPPAGTGAEALLARAVSERSGTGVAVRTRAHPREPVSAPLAGGEAWLPSLRAALGSAREAGRLYACVTLPADSLLPAGSPPAEVAAGARAEAARLPGRAAVASAGEGWSVRLAAAPCASPPAPAPPVSPTDPTGQPS
ncbi:MAG TPA: DUF389 domain-containing protein [Longimicrobium sp.]|nr:DUF389 domain-containing protein [Longimicrobium sp.]